MKRFEAVFHMGVGTEFEWDSTLDVYAEDFNEALEKVEEAADQLMEQFGCFAEFVEMFETDDYPTSTT